MNKMKFFTLVTIILAASALMANSSFLTKGEVSPDSNSQNWQLTISGLVQNPQNFTLADLQSMPQTSESVALYCVDQPNVPVTAGNWNGVKLSYLLDVANVSENAVKVAFFASDGFSTDLTIQNALKEDVILAYQKDSVPLTETLRLIVPGNWGYKWIAKITNIELVDYDYRGYWESSGYPDQANITPIPPFSQSNVNLPRLPSSSPSPIPTPSSVLPSSTPTVSPSITPSQILNQTQPPMKPAQTTNPFNAPTVTIAPALSPISLSPISNTSASPESASQKPTTNLNTSITATVLVAFLLMVVITSIALVLRKRLKKKMTCN